MTLIVRPSGMRIRRVKWALDRPAQVNRSAYTGARRVVANPWHGLWRAQVELAPLIGEANVRAWRAFLARLKGQINTFRLPATEGAQNTNSKVTVASTAAQGATSMSIAGYTSPLLAGQLVTVNGQLLQLTANQSGAVLTFEPPLRAAASAGTGVVTSRPYALVALPDSAIGWSVDPGTVYEISFDAEETIGDADGPPPESELVVNGLFGTDASSWSANANATLSAVAGRLRVTNSGATPAYAFQTINVVPGQTYIVRWDSFTGTTTPRFLVGNSPNSAAYVDVSTSATGQSATITPTQSTITITGQAVGSTATQYAEYDNISLMES